MANCLKKSILNLFYVELCMYNTYREENSICDPRLYTPYSSLLLLFRKSVLFFCLRALPLFYANKISIGFYIQSRFSANDSHRIHNTVKDSVMSQEFNNEVTREI